MTRRQVRVCLGILWLVDATLQAQPALFQAEWWRSDLASSAMAEPSFISHSIIWTTGHIATHSAAVNAAFVAFQAILGICLVVGRFERLAIVASVPWALGVWWVGEGLGMLPTGFALLAAGAPGPVLYYPLLGFLAWPRRDGHQHPIAPRAAMVTWVVLWAGGALLDLPWRFSSSQVLAANLEERSRDQPGWLEALGHHAMTAVAAHPAAVMSVLGLAALAIGLAVVPERTRSMACAGGVVVSLFFWVVFEDLGGVLGGGATDPGSAPLTILLALAIYSSCRRPIRTPRLATGSLGGDAGPSRSLIGLLGPNL